MRVSSCPQLAERSQKALFVPWRERMFSGTQLRAEPVRMGEAEQLREHQEASGVLSPLVAQGCFAL